MSSVHAGVRIYIPDLVGVLTFNIGMLLWTWLLCKKEAAILLYV